MRHGFDHDHNHHRGHRRARKLAAMMGMAAGPGFGFGRRGPRHGHDLFGEHGPFGAAGPFGDQGPFGPHGPFGADGPFGGGMGDRGGGGGGRRGRRGMFGRDELRLLLLSLIGEQPRHGYDLIGALEERSGGHYVPSAGVIYPALALLADEGLITEQPADDTRRRFALSEEGRAVLAAEQDQVAELIARLGRMAERSERARRPQVERAVKNLGMALRQRLMQGGGDDLPHEIASILDEAAQRIERL